MLSVIGNIKEIFFYSIAANSIFSLWKLTPEMRFSTSARNLLGTDNGVRGFQWKLKSKRRKRGREGRKKKLTKQEKERERGRNEEREKDEASGEIAGLISRSGCLAMDVDTRHLLERAATAGYQSSGSSRSWPSIQREGFREKVTKTEREDRIQAPSESTLLQLFPRICRHLLPEFSYTMCFSLYQLIHLIISRIKVLR